ncbi:MAG: hypothetical protein OSB09_02615 [Planctomycetota bacterium]|nr:hypothetical protein [Planctomycetota bacterium]
MNRISQTVLLLLFLSLPVLVTAQNVLSIGDSSALPGDNVSVNVQIAHNDPVLGFSYGATHDGTILTPVSILQGAALLPLNGATGADYFFEDIAPANGPGVVLACIFTFGGALDSLPPGSGQEVATMNYTVAATAAPGSSTAVTPTATLGSPPINIVFTVGGSSIFPSSSGGSVSIEIPAPSGLTSTLSDICSCTHDLSWINNASYTGIQVRLDGALVATLPGSATSTSVILPTTSTNICITGVAPSASSAQTCILDSCAGYTPPAVASGFSCNIIATDPLTGCTADASWTNPGGYSAIHLYIDGVFVETLASAAATSWQGSLGLSPVPQTICIESVDGCGGVMAQVCCQLTCTSGPLFVRGDCNTDGGSNDIADVVAALNFLFGGAGLPPCGDSCDINDDSGFDISDAIFLLSNLFGNGAFPLAPYPGCGEDPTDNDGINCDSFPACP